MRTGFRDSNPEMNPMWFVSWDLLLLVVAEIFVPILDDVDLQLGDAGV